MYVDPHTSLSHWQVSIPGKNTRKHNSGVGLPFRGNVEGRVSFLIAKFGIKATQSDRSQCKEGGKGLTGRTSVSNVRKLCGISQHYPGTIKRYDTSYSNDEEMCCIAQQCRDNYDTSRTAGYKKTTHLSPMSGITRRVRSIAGINKTHRAISG